MIEQLLACLTAEVVLVVDDAVVLRPVLCMFVGFMSVVYLSVSPRV